MASQLTKNKICVYKVCTYKSVGVTHRLRKMTNHYEFINSYLCTSSVTYA
jgi:hypothetical protein